jgi:heme/copper-type cytochrome/quinol oxidase subunit 4
MSTTFDFIQKCYQMIKAIFMNRNMKEKTSSKQKLVFVIEICFIVCFTLLGMAKSLEGG